MSVFIYLGPIEDWCLKAVWAEPVDLWLAEFLFAVC